MAIDRIVIGSTARSSGTKESFHPLWDDNIGQVLQRTLDGEAFRNGSHHQSTVLKRPDYGFLIDGKNCLGSGPRLVRGSKERIITKAHMDV